MWIYPNELPEQVRRQWFWIIKRHTSYTAWLRAYEAYERLISKMESLLPELHGKPYGTYGIGLGTHYEHIFKEWPAWEGEKVKKARFQKSLSMLRAGDKRVLSLSRDRNLMLLLLPNIANLIRTTHYSFLGEHVHEGPSEIYELTIPEKATLQQLAWEADNLAEENVTYTNTRFRAQNSGFDARIMYDKEKNILFAFLLNTPPTTDTQLVNILTRYPIPQNLPPVPEPVLFPNRPRAWWAPNSAKGGPLVVESDKVITAHGIYISEPFEYLRYLHAGTYAPYLDADKQNDISCRWTLIWLDNRYENGAPIPDEESLYFPEKQENTIPNAELTARPGDICPRSGTWRSNLLLTGDHYINKGDVMPGPKQNELGTIIWFWIKNEPPVKK